MQFYDITLTITPDLPVWPGDPKVELERVSKIEDGANANVSRIAMSAHTGTHVDAPYHFLGDSPITVEQMPLSVLTGNAQVIYIPENVSLITRQVLLSLPLITRSKRLLFHTRNSRYWAEKTPGFQKSFVGLSLDAAEMLAEMGVQLIGIDYLSVAPYKNSRPTHEVLLEAGIIILEGIDLSQVPEGEYELCCLPLKLGGADGAPTRAILIKN
jgi:arylformamidase